MSSFLLQRMVNHFPLWTKVRKDPSSFGQRLLSPIAEVFEQLSINQLRMDQDAHLNKDWLGIGKLSFAYLDEADYIQTTRSGGGGLVYVYPTTVTGDGNPVSRVDTFEELMFGIPDRLSTVDSYAYVTDTVWVSTAATTFNAMPEPARLHIEISGSTEWKKKEPLRHRYFNDSYFVRIEGKDQNSLEVVEVVDVFDDGYYKTNIIFSEVTGVEYQGFDGTVEIKWSNVNQDNYRDPWRILVFEDFEAPLKLSLDTDTVNATVETFVTYSGDRYRYGPQYRRPDQVDLNSNEAHSSVVMRDESQVAYEAVDSIVNPQNSYLYVLDNTGWLHLYDERVPDFTEPDISPTFSKDTYMKIEHACSYPRYGETSQLFITNYRPRYPVQKFTVKRKAPSGAIQYLQGDMTWAATSYELRPNMIDNREVWFTKTATVSYDEVGMWQFEITTYTAYDTTNSYSNVLVPGVDATKSIDTGINNPTGLSLSREGYLQVHKGAALTKLREVQDQYVADEMNQRLIFREAYSTLGVTY